MVAHLLPPSPIAPLRATGWRYPFDLRSVPSYRLLGTMLLLIAALVMAFGFAVDRDDLPVMISAQAFLLAVAALLRMRGISRPAVAIEAMVLVLAATMATACLSVLFATTSLPFRDAILDRVDSFLFPPFDWRRMFVLLHDRPRLVAAMCSIYQTLLWQPFVLMALLAMTGREARCWQFVHAWFLALIGCLVIFPFVTATGAYVHFGLSPHDIPALSVDTGWRQPEVLERIRTGAIHSLSPQEMTGIIAFPSFHAAAATLLFWGFRRVPIVGGAFMALNVAMAATAPLVGAHYFVDILAGVAIALVAIRIASPEKTVGIDVDPGL